MISYKQWKLLNESLGTFPLGLSQKQSLGITGSQFSDKELDEMGMGMKPPMGDQPFGKKGKKPFGRPDDMDGEEGPEGEFGDEDGDEEDMDPNDEFGDEDDEDGDDEEGDEDLPIDPDAELDDEVPDDEMEPEDDTGMPMKKKKGPPMGNPHMGGPFMRWSRRMNKEGCDDMDDKGDDDVDGEMVPEKGKGKEVAFLQKKQKKLQKKMASGDTAAKPTTLGKPGHDGKASPKGGHGVTGGKPESQKYGRGKTHTASKFEKHCDAGMGGKKCDAKCAKQKKNMKETSGYERPRSYDPSESEFIRSLKGMFGNPTEKFSDGMRDFSEDLLLPQPEAGPGDPGYAPQTRLGSDVTGVTENLQHLMKKIAELEKQLNSK